MAIEILCRRITSGFTSSPFWKQIYIFTFKGAYSRVSFQIFCKVISLNLNNHSNKNKSSTTLKHPMNLFFFFFGKCLIVCNFAFFQGACPQREILLHVWAVERRSKCRKTITRQRLLLRQMLLSFLSWGCRLVAVWVLWATSHWRFLQIQRLPRRCYWRACGGLQWAAKHMRSSLSLVLLHWVSDWPSLLLHSCVYLLRVLPDMVLRLRRSSPYRVPSWLMWTEVIWRNLTWFCGQRDLLSSSSATSNHSSPNAKLKWDDLIAKILLQFVSLSEIWLFYGETLQFSWRDEYWRLIAWSEVRSFLWGLTDN